MISDRFSWTVVFLAVLTPADSSGQHVGSMANRRTLNEAQILQLGAAAPADINLTPLTLTAEILARAEDFSSGTILTPSVLASGFKQLWGVMCVGGSGELADCEATGGSLRTQAFRGSFSVDFQLQAPANPETEDDALNRVLTSGGVGNLTLSFDLGFIEPANNSSGVMLTGGGTFAWDNSKNLTSVTVPSFAYVRGQVTLGGWSDWIYAAAQLNVNEVLGEATGSTLQQDLNGSTRLNAMLAAAIAKNLFLQIKVLVPTGDEDHMRQNFEVRLVTAFKPLG